MKILNNGETIELKSFPPYYVAERQGKKTNTVRAFKPGYERDEFISSIFDLKYVQISNPSNDMSFTRTITNISMLTVEGVEIYIISWKHEENTT